LLEVGSQGCFIPIAVIDDGVIGTGFNGADHVRKLRSCVMMWPSDKRRGHITPDL
jgi:hypothetical protein